MSWKSAEIRSTKLCGSTPGGARRLLDFLPVLVGAGQEEHLVAVQPLEARHHVGRDRGVGVADMRGAVHVVDRRGDVEALAHGGVIADGAAPARVGAADAPQAPASGNAVALHGSCPSLVIPAVRRSRAVAARLGEIRFGKRRLPPARGGASQFGRTGGSLVVPGCFAICENVSRRAPPPPGRDRSLRPGRQFFDPARWSPDAGRRPTPHLARGIGRAFPTPQPAACPRRRASRVLHAD